jgi:hypothetical protein
MGQRPAQERCRYTQPVLAQQQMERVQRTYSVMFRCKANDLLGAVEAYAFVI